jgi:hypothetical protein
MGYGIYFKIAGWVEFDMLGNNSKTVNNIKNLIIQRLSAQQGLPTLQF